MLGGKPPHPPLVCTIVLAFGNPDGLSRCLETLRAQVAVRQEIGVVQNGAPDSFLDQIAQSFPRVHLIRNGGNVGAAAGRNIGIAWAKSLSPDYLFFMDNDATLAPDALNELIAAARTHSDAGFLGCVIYHIHEPAVVFSAGVWMRRPFFDEHVRRFDPAEETFKVDFIGTGAMLVPFNVPGSIGYFDAELYLGDEDADWCLRGKKAGLKTLVVTKAAAFHDVPRGKFNPRHVYYTTRNRFLVARRYGYFDSFRELMVLRWIFSRGIGMAFADDDLAWSCAFAFFTAVLHAVRGRLGECPAVFDRQSDVFWEGRIKRRIRATRGWQLMRRIKHMVAGSRSANHAV